MFSEGKIVIASKKDAVVEMIPGACARHTLISGDEGSGKTVTVKVLAESFSEMGVPVFCCDASGDLTGLCREGNPAEQSERIPAKLAAQYGPEKYPVRLWDCLGENGIPFRVRVSDLGPEILSCMLGLTEAQSALLQTVFLAADATGLELTDVKDLRAMLKYVNDNRKEYSELYGTVTPTVVSAVQRALLALESDGMGNIFGEPAVETDDLLSSAADGRGTVSVLHAEKLSLHPKIFQSVILWVLTTVCESIAETADRDALNAVFCFDSADLLFSGISKNLTDRIASVLSLLSRKGIGVFFAARSVTAVPSPILAKIGNRIQQRRTLSTPEDKKDIRAAASVFSFDMPLDPEEVIPTLGCGEAIFALCDENGLCGSAILGRILPPRSRMDAATAAEIRSAVNTDPLFGRYAEAVDNVSAYEKIAEAEAELAAAAEAEKPKKAAKKETTASKVGSAAKKTAQKAATSAASSAARSVSTNIVNSIAGGKKKSAKQIAKQSATSALSSVLRSGASSIIRGLFGTKSK